MRYLFVTALLLISITTPAQPFIGLQLFNQGAGIQLGYLVNKIEFTAAYKTPITRNDIPAFASLSIGKQILLSNAPADNFSITPSIGIANYRVQDFTKYNADPLGLAAIEQVSKIMPMYSIELGKDSYLGRYFISAGYCGAMYYGIGLKIFTNRN